VRKVSQIIWLPPIKGNLFQHSTYSLLSACPFFYFSHLLTKHSILPLTVIPLFQKFPFVTRNLWKVLTSSKNVKICFKLINVNFNIFYLRSSKSAERRFTWKDWRSNVWRPNSEVVVAEAAGQVHPRHVS